MSEYTTSSETPADFSPPATRGAQRREEERLDQYMKERGVGNGLVAPAPVNNEPTTPAPRSQVYHAQTLSENSEIIPTDSGSSAHMEVEEGIDPNESLFAHHDNRAPAPVQPAPSQPARGKFAEGAKNNIANYDPSEWDTPPAPAQAPASEGRSDAKMSTYDYLAQSLGNFVSPKKRAPYPSDL